MSDLTKRLRCDASTAVAGLGGSRGVAVVAALFLTLLIVGAANYVTAQEVSIKVLVNDDPISDYDIDQRERFLAITTQEQPSPALKQQAINMLIDERIQLQAGRKEGVTPDEDEVGKILADMAQKNKLDVDGLTTALGKAGVNIKTLKDRVKAQLVWQETVRKKFRHDVQIGDADITAAMTESGSEGAADGEAKPPGEPAFQLRQVKFEIPAGADQGTIAARLAAAENLRGRIDNCADLAKGVEGASVKTLQDQKPSSLVQPARLLVTNAKIGQATPPMITASGVEFYAVCGKRSFRGDDTARAETQRKLMNQEMVIRAERLLRDLKQEAFIEYR
ncbi:MAG TPA: SurA N-terminal domain-containing protein [Methyloceanibacter sp.]|jgi:peptidyl-prolyl cis-trans isomerase SurA|nr:SurA N-terminal domain-containing protein [Methyloceanibacter sp.]